MRDLSLLALMSPPGSHASPCAFIPADGAAIALPPGDAAERLDQLEQNVLDLVGRLCHHTPLA